jgi:hypothetical protein
MSDDPELSDDEIRERTVAFFRPVARQILDGEFDLGLPHKLQFLQEMLVPLDNQICQRAVGYIRCLLRGGKKL